jgi:hypothetical protein
MSFFTEIRKPINTRQNVIIYQISIGKKNTFWKNYAAGCWKVNFNNVYSELASFPTVPQVTSYKTIANVSVNGVELQKMSTAELCVQYGSSFYYEAATKLLIIHIHNGDEPALYNNIVVGVVFGWRHGGQEAVYNGIIYEDRIMDISPLTVSKDPSFWGVLEQNTYSITVNNSDGELDRFTRDNDVFNNISYLMLGFDGDDIADFYRVAQSLTGRIRTNGTSLIIENNDYRTILSKSIPDRVFSDTQYANIKPENINKPIPRRFGVCKKVPIIVYDENKSTADAGAYHGKVNDSYYSTGIKSVDSIYIDDVEIGTSRSTGTNLASGVITLKKTDYAPGQEVAVDCEGEVDAYGATITNGGDVIKKLNYDYYEIAPTNDNYTNYSAFVSDVGISLHEQKPIIDIAGEIAESCRADFKSDGDGKFNLRKYSPSAASLQTFERNQIIETGEVDDDPTEIVSSIAVGYSRRWATDEYLLYVDRTRETEIHDKWNIYKQLRFDTLLVSIDDAEDFTSGTMDFSAEIKTLFSVQIPGWLAVMRNIGDFIIVEFNRPYKQFYNHCMAEIISISKNLIGRVTDITCRLIAIIATQPYQQGNYYSTKSGINYYTNNIKYCYSVTISGAIRYEL